MRMLILVLDCIVLMICLMSSGCMSDVVVLMMLRIVIMMRVCLCLKRKGRSWWKVVWGFLGCVLWLWWCVVVELDMGDFDLEMVF